MIRSCCFNPSPAWTAPKAYWQVTRRCNLECLYCKISEEKSKNDLVTEDMLKIIDELAFLGVDKILFTGGEPLLRDDFFSIVEYAVKKNIELTMTTNGTLINEETAKKLKRLGFLRVSVGIDGPNADVHNSIRSYSFDKAIGGIKELVKQKIPVTMMSVPNRYNFEEIEGIIDLAARLKVEAVVFNRLWPVTEKSYELQLTSEQYKKILDIIEEKRKSIKTLSLIPVRFLQDNFLQGCVAGRDIYGVTSEGDLVPCLWFSDVGSNLTFGNLLDEKFFEKFKAKNEHKLIGILREAQAKRMENEICKECKYKLKCGRGCLASSLLHFGDLNSIDPLCSYSEGGEGRR